MKDDERDALAALRFDIAPVPDDVWRDSPFHVEALHGEILRKVVYGIKEATASPDGSPMGVAMQGEVGSGKTHLLGWVRRQTHEMDGYFFLLDLLDGSTFWKSAALAIVGNFHRDHLGQGSQLTVFLTRLCSLVGVDEATASAVRGHSKLRREHLDELVTKVRATNHEVATTCQNTLRALVLFAGGDPPAIDIGYNYLQSLEEMSPGERYQWGIHPEPKLPQHIVKELSHLLALTWPTVIAIDQIDTLIAQAMTNTAGKQAELESDEQIMLLNQIADGLMSLRQITHRTLTVLACLPSTWVLIRTRTTKSVADRFHTAVNLGWIPSAKIAESIIEKRFRVKFALQGFEPPYETWPIARSAFEDATAMTPRRLIKRVNDHVEACLQEGVVLELSSLTGEGGKPKIDDPYDPAIPPDAGLDLRFANLQRSADVNSALVPGTEDIEMTALLHAGIQAWLVELGRHRDEFALDLPMGGKLPALHARLKRTLDDATQDEQHWSFRAISSGHGNAALGRIQAARTSSGLSSATTKRKLYLLRNTAWSKGPKNQEALQSLMADGGTLLPISEQDLRTFSALRQMLAERDPGLADWLAARRPAGRTMLLRTVLGEVAAEFERAESPEPIVEHSLFEPAVEVPADGTSIMVGTGIDDGKPLRVDLESLRKHTAIFAGSGSGKTVLIRRLIEECALQGVSTIVLDPNNDLARLGDAWPAEPSGWLGGDAAKARTYLETTDVVIWTPRREAGRPLSFQPLPDFRDVIADRDEFGAAIDSAVASLAPRAKVDATTAKAERGRAVLNESLRYFARHGGEGIRSFIGALSALPEGVSQLEDAEKIAFEMSQNLTAAMVNDPLFGGEGAPADPGLLLTPAPGKRARVSVISFVGLPSEGQRQSFVNQLQMALFAWIKKNPAGDRPLGGLLVMDEAQTLAPSGAMTACTQSTLALASQARKYGLGLVFATQAPKGLHNRISGNAATQFFGLLNAPAQIDAAREMARAKGSDVSDISRLGTGEFYASGEGFEFRKVRSPLCLSHHPKSPLTPEEVIERARAGR